MRRPGPSAFAIGHEDESFTKSYHRPGRSCIRYALVGGVPGERARSSIVHPATVVRTTGEGRIGKKTEALSGCQNLKKPQHFAVFSRVLRVAENRSGWLKSPLLYRLSYNPKEWFLLSVIGVPSFLPVRPLVQPLRYQDMPRPAGLRPTGQVST